MELSWTTFVLEIINFLVLVWILKHFLYQPVLDVVARRRAGIDKQLNDARQLQADAESLRKQYEGRLRDWEQERREAREALHAELNAERQGGLDKLHRELAEERKRFQVAETRRLADVQRGLEIQALQQGGRFATRLLEQGAGIETQQRLIDLLIRELSTLAPQSVAALQHQYGKGEYGEGAASVVISSAFPIDGGQRQHLVKALEFVISEDAAIKYEEDRSLLAGVSIRIGAWQLGANIKDELLGFAELTQHD